jgi:hypothetical protein
MTDKHYAELVSQAELAVSSVKDPELKRVAFEKILDDLLAGGQGQRSAVVNAIPKRRRPQKRAASGGARAKRSGPQGYIQEMIEEGFFDKQKTLAEVKAELENRGHHIPITTLSKPLQRLCQNRKLRRQKIESNGNRKTFGYSKW